MIENEDRFFEDIIKEKLSESKEEIPDNLYHSMFPKGNTAFHFLRNPYVTLSCITICVIETICFIAYWNNKSPKIKDSYTIFNEKKSNTQLSITKENKTSSLAIINPVQNFITVNQKNNNNVKVSSTQISKGQKQLVSNISNKDFTSKTHESGLEENVTLNESKNEKIKNENITVLSQKTQPEQVKSSNTTKENLSPIKKDEPEIKLNENKPILNLEIHQQQSKPLLIMYRPFNSDSNNCFGFKMSMINTTKSFNSQNNTIQPLTDVPHKPNSKLSIDVFIEPSYNDLQVLTNKSTYNLWAKMYKNGQEGALSWSFGIETKYDFKRFFFQTGIDFSLLSTQGNYNLNIPNTNNPSVSLKSTYRYLEIPLLLGYKLTNSRFNIDISTGYSVGLYISSSGETLNPEYTDLLEFSGTSLPFNKYIYNFILRIGCSYILNDKFTLLMNPTYRLNLNSIYDNSYPISLKYYNIGVNLGINYRF